MTTTIASERHEQQLEAFITVISIAERFSAKSTDTTVLEDAFRKAFSLLDEAGIEFFRVGDAVEEVLTWQIEGKPGMPLDEALIEAARAHGEISDIDHIAGDLHDLLRDVMGYMTASQRDAFFAIPEISRVIATAQDSGLQSAGTDGPEPF